MVPAILFSLDRYSYNIRYNSLIPLTLTVMCFLDAGSVNWDSDNSELGRTHFPMMSGELDAVRHLASRSV